MRRRTFIHLLGGGSLLALGSPLWLHQPARAEGSGGVPVFSLINQSLEFMKRSGDMQLELGAINLKLDLILRNQLEMFAALQAMNETLDNVQRYITEIPSETITLTQVIEAQSRFKSVADNISALSRRPQDKEALAGLQEDRKKLYDLSNSLFAAIAATTRPPGITIAANHLVNAAALIDRYDSSRTKRRASDTDSERFKTVLFNIRSSLQTMTGDGGIKTRLPLINEKYKLRTAEIASQPFAKLLPKDYSQPVPDQDENRSASNPKSLCLMSSVASSVTHHEVLRDVNPSGAGTHVSGFLSDVRETRSLETVQYDVVSLRAYGGRRAFQVSMKPSDTWRADSWSRMVRKQSDWNDRETSAEPRTKMDGCVEVADNVHGSPQAFGLFQGYLQGYSALVGLEARILALQHVAEDDLQRVTALYDRQG